MLLPDSLWNCLRDGFSLSWLTWGLHQLVSDAMLQRRSRTCIAMARHINALVSMAMFVHRYRCGYCCNNVYGCGLRSPYKWLRLYGVIDAAMAITMAIYMSTAYISPGSDWTELLPLMWVWYWLMLWLWLAVGMPMLSPVMTIDMALTVAIAIPSDRHTCSDCCT